MKGYEYDWSIPLTLGWCEPAPAQEKRKVKKRKAPFGFHKRKGKKHAGNGELKRAVGKTANVG